MSKLLNTKVVLVTGAGSGIGEASAKLAAAEGAAVVVADLVETEAERVASEIADSGGKALAHRCDVRSRAEVDGLVQATVASFGRLDGAHNNAGIGGSFGDISDYPVEDFDVVFDIDVRGLFHCLQAELLVMRGFGGGSIVNTSSITAVSGWPNYLPALGAAKAAVEGLTRTAALSEAQRGIRVNAIRPGSIATPLVLNALAEHPELADDTLSRHPMARLGRPDEVAQAVIWLLSDRASFVTGIAMPIDGGYLIR